MAFQTYPDVWLVTRRKDLYQVENYGFGVLRRIREIPAIVELVLNVFQEVLLSLKSSEMMIPIVT